jgi:hypothetical protein
MKNKDIIRDAEMKIVLFVKFLRYKVSNLLPMVAVRTTFVNLLLAKAPLVHFLMLLTSVIGIFLSTILPDF